MHKYIIADTSHLKDSVQDDRSEIYRAIKGKPKRATEEAFDRILYITGREMKAKAVDAAKKYILGTGQGLWNP